MQQLNNNHYVTPISLAILIAVGLHVLHAQSGSRQEPKPPTAPAKYTKQKKERTKLKTVQKRTSLSIAYAKISTKRMLTQSRIAKRDQEALTTKIMNKAQPKVQNGRIDRKIFNNLVQEEIKSHKQAKKAARSKV